MNLYHGIGLGIIGLIIGVLGFTNILPNMGASGVFLVLLSAIVIGLSFIPQTDTKETEPMPVWERLLKMFYSPSEVFKNLKSHPKWIIAILVAAIFSSIYTTAFFQRLTPERITNVTSEKLAESGFVSEEQLVIVKKQSLAVNSSRLKPLADLINSFVLLFLLTAVLALIFAIGILLFGGKLNYFQAFAVVAYSMLPVTIAQKTLSLILLYLKDPIEIHTIMGQSSLVIDNFSFLVSAADNPILFTVLANLGLLMLYWVWLMSLGLRITGEKVSTTVGWILPLFIWLIFLSLGVISATFFSSFIS